jgi:glycolate oxidase FAD binding subunit
LSVPQTAPVIEVPGVSASAQYIEWQGAQRWLWAPMGAAPAIHAAAQAVGGSAQCFRSAGNRDGSVFAPMPEALLRIQRALQEQFDPQGVFATGRMGH